MNKKKVLSEIKKGTLFLKDADDKLKADEEVVLESVKLNGLYLKFADDKYEDVYKKQAVKGAWETSVKRYKKNMIREKDSFLSIVDTLTYNYISFSNFMTFF